MMVVKPKNMLELKPMLTSDAREKERLLYLKETHDEIVSGKVFTDIV